MRKPERAKKIDEQAEEGGGVDVVGPEEVVAQDEEDGEAADAVQGGDVAEAAGGISIRIERRGSGCGRGLDAGHGVRIRGLVVKFSLCSVQMVELFSAWVCD
jgi:hypothetical protein